MKMPRLLELFSGTQSVSKIAKTLGGWETLSLDLDPRFSPDLCMDILDFDETQYPKDYFAFVWSSCPCEAYSQARTKAKIPVDEAMATSDKLVKKTREIIDYFGCAAWCIENPALSRIWKREVAHGLLAKSIVTSYCSFGYAYRKNTRISSSFPLTLPICPGKGSCPQMIRGKHMEHAQRGCGGCQSRRKTVHELHMIPEELVRQIFKQLNVGSSASAN